MGGWIYGRHNIGHSGLEKIAKVIQIVNTQTPLIPTPIVLLSNAST